MAGALVGLAFALCAISFALILRYIFYAIYSLYIARTARNKKERTVRSVSRARLAICANKIHNLRQAKEKGTIYSMLDAVLFQK